MKYGPLLTNRCHNARFWQIFHSLLKKAEEQQIYQNPFRNNPEFITLTQKIKDNYLKNNAQQMPCVILLFIKIKTFINQLLYVTGTASFF